MNKQVVRYLYRLGISAYLLNMSSMQQRKAEILAKRAKLAELKRQRELRQQEFSLSRANSGEASEVWGYSLDGVLVQAFLDIVLTIVTRLYHPYPAAQTVEQSSMT